MRVSAHASGSGVPNELFAELVRRRWTEITMEYFEQLRLLHDQEFRSHSGRFIDATQSQEIVAQQLQTEIKRLLQDVQAAKEERTAQGNAKV
ncbi:hypothetical protein BV898_01162 [Hypsibius exemplaris]|uniref:Uncharacterized protein n=1 Tax=Hypsibius exemplaris TaxID=2072580 RepID=A0A1W0XC97_HYPEX|nr:hypothetical protein BV898_01162 [Hypsibius exemplaris]